ncbi:hypothetical protein VP1G_03020 [Cytospora mali]|uniref:D-isomer specific 2-hydroxyacid dehydrogenase NAD-binding domain-containing protein n=1 Tax=Cytospora mali TaxID=578113 RepID=A0A194UVT0_CYTMA|nr:hypothetical protein VP1G_03020 [Valsa mali var. pyri (nom. inval.)]
MLLQKLEIDGASTHVKSHGQHHRGHGPDEEVVLCAVYHFAEPTEAIRKLQIKFPHVRFIWHTVEDRFGVDYEGVIPDADYRAATIYLTFGHSPPSQSLMPNLRFIQLLTSGHDHLRSTPLLSDPSIPVATCSGVSARPIAQHVVLQILSFAHQWPRALRVMEEGKWIGPESKRVGGRGYPVGSVLAGKRVGIWGYGSIGRQVARILHAMGMHIIACASGDKSTPESRRLRTATPFSDTAMGDDDGTLPVEWHSGSTRAGLQNFLAADLDILAIFTPLTSSTKHALGKEEFDILSRRSLLPQADHTSHPHGRGKPQPFLVNVSRGPIIVQDELVSALKDGRLAGAALDVTDPEPLPENQELWSLPNVSITPHMSWCFEEYVEECIGTVLEENLRRLSGGKTLLNQI